VSEQIDKALDWGTRQLEDHSESARLDAELLLAHCLEKPRSFLYSWPEKTIGEDAWQRFRELIRRRRAPTPVAYLVGRREFFSLEYATAPEALVPRPETELLVEMALDEIPPAGAAQICDLGTGTGIIAITLKKHRPECRVVATDLDPRCLTLARDNARRHGVEIDWIASNWFRGLAGGARFDLILSNPPYIAAGHPFLAQGDLPAEPRLALTPGDTGLEALQTIVGEAAGYLLPDGLLMVEHGYDQQASVAKLFAASGFEDIRCEYDFNDLPRVTRGRLTAR
jgi:release factor glutamine methyltransferase